MTDQEIDEFEQEIEQFESGNCPKCKSNKVKKYVEVHGTNIYRFNEGTTEFELDQPAEVDETETYEYLCDNCDYEIQTDN